jgi:aerobic carbon-monoxide dehydrogenase small subunit
MSEAENIRLAVNGKVYEARLPTSMTLADFLRDDLNLIGCRIGCDQAVCGACTVLVDETPRAACATFVWAVSGACILTIEGLSGSDRSLHPLQTAFLEADAFQCGYCTAGMILAAKALLDCNPDPDEADIRSWLSGNLCRCTGYQMIVEAVLSAAAAIRKGRS